VQQSERLNVQDDERCDQNYFNAALCIKSIFGAVVGWYPKVVKFWYMLIIFVYVKNKFNCFTKCQQSLERRNLPAVHR